MQERACAGTTVHGGRRVDPYGQECGLTCRLLTTSLDGGGYWGARISPRRVRACSDRAIGGCPSRCYRGAMRRVPHAVLTNRTEDPFAIGPVRIAGCSYAPIFDTVERDADLPTD